jgi:hypothetical protein
LRKSSERKISYSEFKTWNECTHKHKLIYIDNIPHFSGNEFTAFGTAIHKACEEKVQKVSVDALQVFEETFLEELREIKESGQEMNRDLISEMRSQAVPICEQFLPAVIEHFGDFEVFSVEEALMEKIDDFNAFGRKFKGFIDLVVKTPDGKYHIIDWKTCSWGWSSQKKQDKLVNYQLTLYKHYFAKKHSIDPKLIETYFGLLKRTAKKDNIEIHRATSAEKKTNNCLNLLEKSVINIERKVSIKNRLSCKYCKFYKTENCR